MRRRLPPGLWLDRALCALLALLSVAALFHGFRSQDDGLAGLGIAGLIAAGWIGTALFDQSAFRRSRALREAVEKASRSRERNP
ncbi:hypothetical protein GmRootV59_26960 [Variovorax sp. V59]